VTVSNKRIFVDYIFSLFCIINIAIGIASKVFHFIEEAPIIHQIVLFTSMQQTCQNFETEKNNIQ